MRKELEKPDFKSPNGSVELGKTAINGNIEIEREQIISDAELNLRHESETEKPETPSFDSNPPLDPDHPHIIPGQD